MGSRLLTRLSAAVAILLMVAFFAHHLLALEMAWAPYADIPAWVRRVLHFPSWLRPSAWLLFFASRGVLMWKGARYRALDASLIGVALIYLSVTSLPLFEPSLSSQQLVSRMTSVLSTTHQGVPLVGLFAMIVCVGLEFLVRRDGLVAFGYATTVASEIPRSVRFSARASSLVVLLLSSATMLGYATGGPLPVPG